MIRGLINFLSRGATRLAYLVSRECTVQAKPSQWHACVVAPKGMLCLPLLLQIWAAVSLSTRELGFTRQ